MQVPTSKSRTVVGRIHSRLLVNALVDPEEVAAFLPDGLRPHVSADGGTVVGCCLLEIRELRPGLLPAVVGVRLRSAAHRIAVEWTSRDGRIESGVYVPLRHTDSRLASLLGGRVFPGMHDRATVEVEETPDSLSWRVTGHGVAGGFDLAAVVDTASDEADPVPEVGSVCVGASIGHSPDRHGRLEGVCMVPAHLDARVVSVRRLRSTFLDGFHSAVPAPAYLMRDVGVTWSPVPVDLRRTDDGGHVKVVIAGGSGSLGRRLAAELDHRGFEVVILTRSPRGDDRYRQVRWDGRTIGEWAAELNGAVLVNLAGELVDRRPTAKNIELLQRSRVEPTQALVVASKTCDEPPPVWLQMSTLAIYGDGGEEVIDEQHSPADGPAQMAGVATAWEDALDGANVQRVVTLRSGIVLDNGTPAFNRLTRLTRLGLGGRIGTGEQWISWIHIDDFLRTILFLVDQRSVEGVVHVTSPNPIRNRDMMASLRSALHRPWSPPTPKSLVRLGALLMRTDPALALTGRRCVPGRLSEFGFVFERTTFGDAVADLVSEPAR